MVFLEFIGDYNLLTMRLTVCVSRLQPYFCFALTTEYREQDSKPNVQFSMLNINFALK